MVRQHQTSDAQCASGNLEIPGSMLTHCPGMTGPRWIFGALAYN
jgi:hypothetical protein